MKFLFLMVLFVSPLNKVEGEIKYFDLGHDYQENVTFYFNKNWGFRRTFYQQHPGKVW